ncbi:Malonyl CoA-acyl carrier protein transacylase [Pirellulimonas nuda]|uniref:Malonyl CoA-acyl carrier protein transacylase n=1 Tax=Pirellulimonas nuda TaxID=2528009 RepID=A0A518DA23_9BACT|nr:ACP S-malonyltransferase [Pirellulimonas nuda]QDU88276.1 Malonyl CoA-acyl carrier protein transacylase [Pirellulimonas nuda]
MGERIALLFPGQGAQSVGMGKELCQRLPAAAALFSRASDILGYDLLELCAGGPAEELDSTAYSQPAIFVASLAALEELKQQSPEVVEQCSASAGLSLGEYTALVFAGVMSFEDGLRVVAERGAAMQDASEASPSGMVSILGLDLKVVTDVCDQARGDDVLDVANMLCPGNIVVSGSTSACERVGDLAEAAGAMRVVPLAVAGAFHTALMAPAVDRVAAKLAGATLNAPRIPVVSNVDALPHSDPEEIRDLLIRQVVNPVRWEDSIRWLLDQHGAGRFYEVGPGRVLKGLMKRIDRKASCENVTA